MAKSKPSIINRMHPIYSHQMHNWIHCGMFFLKRKGIKNTHKKTEYHLVIEFRQFCWQYFLHMLAPHGISHAYDYNIFHTATVTVRHSSGWRWMGHKQKKINKE